MNPLPKPSHSSGRRARRAGLSAAMLLCACVLAAVPAARAEEQVIYPRSAPQTGVPAPRESSGPGLLLPLVALAAAAAGGWLLWRQRTLAGGHPAGARRLNVAESRSLGNRQYLVVAEYDGRKFLLGVCPGRIDMLSPLDGDKK